MLDLQRLKGRILVKGKKSEDSRIPSDQEREEEDEEEDEEEGAGAIEQRRRVSGPAWLGRPCGARGQVAARREVGGQASLISWHSYIGIPINFHEESGIVTF